MRGLPRSSALLAGPARAASTGGPVLRFRGRGNSIRCSYLAGLAGRDAPMAGRIFVRTHAGAIAGACAGARARAAEPTIAADAVVVATNTPDQRSSRAAHQAGGLRSLCRSASACPKGTVPQALYWDTERRRITTSGSHARARVRRRAAHRRRRGPQDRPGGRHRQRATPGSRPGRASGSRALARSQFRWSGQVMESIDGLAFIGREPRRRRTSTSRPATRAWG